MPKVYVDREPDMSVFQQARINYIFVYGTLKRTFGNNRHIKDLCTYTCNDALKGFMLHLGGFPCYIPEESGMEVHGEVWKVPDLHYKAVMSALDSLEGVPHLYYRYAFRTKGGFMCWAYWMPRDRIDPKASAVILDGKWNGANLSKAQIWEQFMLDNPQYNFPKKPASYYEPTVQGWVCDYFSTARMATSKAYAEVGSDGSKVNTHVSFIGPPKSILDRPGEGVIKSLPPYDVRTEKPKPPEKKIPSFVDLAWLDDIYAEKYVTCEEHHVDSI
jgi:gamma-glutamylcyclotransferase (GGCT)/AIG2-like uncharacterized protein YtfP